MFENIKQIVVNKISFIKKTEKDNKTLLNNKFTLFKSTSLTVQIYAYILLTVGIIAVTGYFLVNSMSVVNGNLNINKIEKINKIYSRSIYIDYYFRVITSTNNEETGSYSNLSPLKISMGYDLTNTSEPQFLLEDKNLINGTITSEIKEINLSREYIEKIKNFKNIFGKIVATQDQTYFDKSQDETEDILNNLYKDSPSLPLAKVSSYYSVVPVSINNLKINHFKLNNFKLSNSLGSEKSWQPNIAKWKYGNSSIYLQLIKEEKSETLDDMSKSITTKKLKGKGFFSIFSDNKDVKNNTLVKSIKINENKISKFYFVLNEKNNEVSSYFMSNDGYLYLLKLRANSKQSLLNNMDDYLKIAYGIYFSEEATDSWFLTKQKEVEIDFKSTISLVKGIQKLEEKLDKNISVKYEFSGKWADKLEDFKSFYKQYPNSNIIKKLEKKKNSLEKEIEEKSLFNQTKNLFKG